MAEAHRQHRHLGKLRQVWGREVVISWVPDSRAGPQHKGGDQESWIHSSDCRAPQLHRKAAPYVGNCAPKPFPSFWETICWPHKQLCIELTEMREPSRSWQAAGDLGKNEDLVHTLSEENEKIRNCSFKIYSPLERAPPDTPALGEWFEPPQSRKHQ